MQGVHGCEKRGGVTEVAFPVVVDIYHGLSAVRDPIRDPGGVCTWNGRD